MAEPSTTVIGLLEDDDDQARQLSEVLAAAGFVVRRFESLAALRRRDAEVAQCAAMLIDWSLPDGSGLDVLRQAPPQHERRIPMILLTARTAEADIVAGLDAGADDYVTKPARPAELTARLRAALRRVGNARDRMEDLAPYTFDRERRTIAVHGEAVVLTAREYDLAIYLFHHIGQAVTRQAILRDVFNLGPQVITRSLDTHVSRLRRKLGLSGEHGFKLISIYQTGYRLSRA